MGVSGRRFQAKAEEGRRLGSGEPGEGISGGPRDMKEMRTQRKRECAMQMPPPGCLRAGWRPAVEPPQDSHPSPWRRPLCRVQRGGLRPAASVLAMARPAGWAHRGWKLGSGGTVPGVNRVVPGNLTPEGHRDASFTTREADQHSLGSSEKCK